MNTSPIAHFEIECIELEHNEAIICIAIVVEIVGNGLLILVVVFDIAFGLVHTSILFFRGGFKNP